MALRWKIDINEALKKNGFSSYRLRKEKLMGQKTLQDFRNGTVILTNNLLEKLCSMLHLQPGDILEYVQDKEEEKE